MPVFVTLALSFLKKLVFKTFGEVVIDQILDNPKLRKQVFFFFAREAVKWTDTTVDDELLNKIIEANNMGPTSENDLAKAVGKKNLRKAYE